MLTFKEALKLNLGKDDTEKNKRFVDTFLNRGTRSPMDPSISVYEIDGVPVQLAMKPARDGAYIATIMVMSDEMKKGAGSKLLKTLTLAADRAEVKLKLIARPLKNPAGKTIPAAKLRSWYKKFGFELDGQGTTRDNMSRLPKKGVDIF